MMQGEVWATIFKEFHGEESLFPQTLIAYYKQQIKVKIWSERERLSSIGFGESSVTVVRLCRVVGVSLTFNLENTGT